MINVNSAIKKPIQQPIDKTLWKQVEKAFLSGLTNQQAQAFVEKWARDELENRGEGKELEILQFFEQ